MILNLELSLFTTISWMFSPPSLQLPLRAESLCYHELNAYQPQRLFIHSTVCLQPSVVCPHRCIIQCKVCLLPYAKFPLPLSTRTIHSRVSFRSSAKYPFHLFINSTFRPWSNYHHECPLPLSTDSQFWVHKFYHHLLNVPSPSPYLPFTVEYLLGHLLNILSTSSSTHHSDPSPFITTNVPSPTPKTHSSESITFITICPKSHPPLQNDLLIYLLYTDWSFWAVCQPPYTKCSLPVSTDLPCWVRVSLLSSAKCPTPSPQLLTSLYKLIIQSAVCSPPYAPSPSLQTCHSE